MTYYLVTSQGDALEMWNSNDCWAQMIAEGCIRHGVNIVAILKVKSKLLPVL